MVDEAIKNRAVELLGAAQPVSKPTKKENLVSFRKGHVFVALKLVSQYDRESQQYEDPVPKITFLVDGKYVRMPVDSSLLKSLGKFLGDLGDILEGVEVPERSVDIEEARRIISSCSGRHPE